MESAFLMLNIIKVFENKRLPQSIALLKFESILCLSACNVNRKVDELSIED